MFKEGDTVALLTARGIEKRRVDRVTDTQAIVGGQRFRRKSGRQLGSDVWDVRWIEPWGDEHEQKLARQNQNKARAHLISRLANYPWHNFNLEQLQSISDFVGVTSLLTNVERT